mmetsp:Transcript_924/g.2397  ORF Transcript_924/g.2397 Transcript_924/m.2397 type:complete len:138 (-) Transcript_924:33-446(-)
MRPCNHMLRSPHGLPKALFIHLTRQQKNAYLTSNVSLSFLEATITPTISEYLALVTQEYSIVRDMFAGFKHEVSTPKGISVFRQACKRAPMCCVVVVPWWCIPNPAEKHGSPEGAAQRNDATVSFRTPQVRNVHQAA